jgi:hypothetical protein
MDRDALAELSREQLIELVLGLAAEAAELKAQQGQPPKTPGNSSVPSSVGFKASRVERRARKRRRGHDGISRRRRIENAVDRLVSRTLLPEQPDIANARRLQARYRAHRAGLFVFFDRPNVPPTNNASEQDLRPSVIHRKVIGGFRSQRGADVSAILTSLLTTARKRGENLFQALRTVAGPSPLDACSAPAFVEARAG